MAIATATVNQQQVNELLAALNGSAKRASSIISQTLNREGRRVRTGLIRSITKTINIKAGDISGKKDTTADKDKFHKFGGVQQFMASANKLETSIRVTGTRVPLVFFNAKQRAGVKVTVNRRGAKAYKIKTKQGGASYRILKAGGKTVVRQAFFATTKSGHTGVFWRYKTKKMKGGKKAAIYELKGPSIVRVAETSNDIDLVVKLSSEKIAAEIQRRVLVQLRKRGGVA